MYVQIYPAQKVPVLSIVVPTRLTEDELGDQILSPDMDVHVSGFMRITEVTYSDDKKRCTVVFSMEVLG